MKIYKSLFILHSSFFILHSSFFEGQVGEFIHLENTSDVC